MIKNADLLGLIEDCYGIYHIEGMRYILDDIHSYLGKRGTNFNIIEEDFDSLYNKEYELCCGSGFITLNKSRSKLEVVNDLDIEIFNLFDLMANKETGKVLLDRLLKLQYSEPEFERAKRAQANNFRYVDRYRMAEMSFILITQSFNSTRQNWRKGVAQKDYTRMLLKYLPEVHKRLQGVRVLNMDCIDILERIRGNSNACVLLDVPYRQELRGK